jgi:hypothetical protein
MNLHLLEHIVSKQFFRSRTVGHLHLQTLFDQISKTPGVRLGDRIVIAHSDLSAEARKVISEEGRVESCQLVEETAERPDIHPSIILVVIPNLRTCVVGSSSLSLGVLSFQNFRNIQISNLGHACNKKDVSWFDISVNNVAVMEGLKSTEDIVGHLPDKILRELLVLPFFLFDETLNGG